MEDNSMEILEAVPTNENLNTTANSTTELAPLTSNSLQYFDSEAQKEILAVAEQIDVRELENVMSYGQIPLLRSFEESGKILRDEEGSSADQEVIKQVVELSKQANQSYDEFNIVLKEPNLLQRLFLKISSASKDKHDKEVALKAITNYKLLEQLMASCDKWIEMLQDGFTKIQASALHDKANCEEIEKYIVAGRIAQERISREVDEAREKYALTSLAADKEDYETLREGAETFNVVLLNLEKSRAASAISIGQLYLQTKTNKNVQIAVRTQKANSMALAAQQLRNAVLGAKNKIALEGQKSISTLNNELMKKVSESTVLTAEESEKILLNGVYSVEAALTAAKTVIDGCEVIKKAREERNAGIAQELGKLKTLLAEIEPFVTRLEEGQTADNSSTSSKTSSTAKSSLKF